jgi:hypothetical protein
MGRTGLDRTSGIRTSAPNERYDIRTFESGRGMGLGGL